MGGEPGWGGHPKIAARVARDSGERRRLETAARFGVAPPVYDGAPTVHHHYDADGNLTGTTEILSPWDDDARAEAEALWEADQLVCGTCGNLREDCSNPDFPWHAQRHRCYAKREQEAADRLYGEKHKDKPFTNRHETRWVEKPDKSSPFHFRDGVRVYVAPVDLNPDDNFI